MRKFLTLFVSILFILSYTVTKADRVDLDTARKIAANFYFETAVNRGEKIIAPENLVLSYTEFSGSEEIFYVFSTANGYIVISADDDAFPVLAYSHEGKFNPENISPEFSAWMNSSEQQIGYIKEHSLQADKKINETWNKYLANDFTPQNSKNGSKSVEPLLTSKWDQGRYYNYLCPEDAAGLDGHVWAGCVATAMAQVMYYYRYPSQGTGSHGYYSDYGYLSADFANTTYNWSAMQNEITNGYNFDMAQLQYHLGISVDMMYSPQGSGAYMWDDADAMKTHFGYSSTTELFNRYNYNDNDWANLLIANLDNKMPVQYAGYGSSGGHAFVCDGYQGNDFFHFNWGWSGSNNGYFYLNNLNPSYTFDNGHQAILNSYPAVSFPQNCAGLTTITNSYGTIEDGSSPINNYQNNKDCIWLIEPNGAIDYIHIIFDRFETEINNDIVTIYDGESTSDSVLGVFSGNIIPPEIISTGKKVLIRFTTNGSINKNGWLLSFNSKNTVFCNNLTELNSSSGTITDGSGVNNYRDYSSCKWRINLPVISTININFNSFNLANDNDFIRIYDETAVTTIATFTSTSPPQSLSLVTDKVLVFFKTNGSINEQGWELNYTSTPLAIRENEGSYLLIAPNPVTDYLNIESNLQGSGQVDITIVNSLGETVLNKKVNSSGNKLTDRLDVSRFAHGIYFIRLSADNFLQTQKFTIQ